MIVDMYFCGACDSTDLVLVGTIDHWDVTCGNGHRLVPIPGTVLTVISGHDPVIASD
jgi:hypothetical protein